MKDKGWKYFLLYEDWNGHGFEAFEEKEEAEQRIESIVNDKKHQPELEPKDFTIIHGFEIGVSAYEVETRVKLED